MGWARRIFFREKEWAKREFHDGGGRVIVCFVKNHTHFIGDSVVDGATLYWVHRQTFSRHVRGFHCKFDSSGL